MSENNGTRSFIDSYLHASGESEVPPNYSLWCAIGLIAAAVADRVYTEKFGKLPPNLYIALLGPSANGKDTAIDMMVDLAMQHPRIGVFNSRTTAPALLQYMTRERTDERGMMHPNAKLYVVMPEVSMSLRKGDIADDFIKTITALYSRKPYPLSDVTITRGPKILKEHCLNVMIGSVLEWLLDVVPHTAISGGTFGRFVGVHQEYNLALRVEKPRRPRDYDAVMDTLHERLEVLTQLEGPFVTTPHAAAIKTQWYTERAVPDDASLIPAWKRQDDLVLKLAMVLSLSDAPDLVIRGRHMWEAQRLSESVIRRLADIQAAASTSKDTQGIVFVRQVLRALKRPVLRTELLKRVIGKGIGGADQLSGIMESLKQTGEVHEKPAGRSIIYTYTGRRRMPPKPTVEA